MAGRANRRGWGWIRKLPSRRYHASYIGPDGLRHNAPTTFGVKIDAEAWLVGERRLIDRGEWEPPAQRKAARKVVGMTVAEYAARWIEQRTLKHRTREHYRVLLANHIEGVLGSVPLKSLTPATVRSWFASLDPSHPTINAHSYRLLHSVCGTAVEDEVLEVNPCAIPRASQAPSNRQPQILTVVELATVADTISPPRFRALVLICAWCGLRWGEATELRRKDLSGDASVIYVGRGVTHRNGCHVGPPKSGRTRTVVVPPHIRGDIRHHLDTFVNADPEALLFPAAKNGCHLANRGFALSLDTACKNVGRSGVRIHDLRHHAGTQVARVSSLRETMDHLGHSSPSTSLKYQHIVSGRQVEIAMALSELAEAQGGNVAL